MKAIQELPQCFREALAYHEAFRRLGFAAKDIYLVSYPDQNIVGVELQANDRLFFAICGQGTYNAEESKQWWADAAQFWKSCLEDDRQALWNSSYVRNHTSQFVAALHFKGFEWPSTDDVLRN